MGSKSKSYIVAAAAITVLGGFIVPLKAGKNKTYTSIEHHVFDKKLSVKLTSLGGHTGACIRMDLSNETTDTLFIRLEPGRRLVSDDTTEQDIFVVKEQLVMLLPRARKPITAYGFCCESNMHSPDVNKKFSLGYMAPPAWVKLAEYLNKNSFETGAMQSAVWVLSNNHQLSSVNETNQNKTLQLRNKLSEITGKEVPWYSLYYAEERGTVFTDRAEKLTGVLNFTLRESSVIIVQVRDEQGNVIATPSQGSQYNGGEQTYALDLIIKGWAKGKYTVFVFQNGMRQVMKKEFTI